MKIRTTEEISVEDYSKVANKEWVLVDELLSYLNQVQMTFFLQPDGEKKAEAVNWIIEDIKLNSSNGDD